MPYIPTPVMNIAYPQSPLNQFVTAQKEIKKEKQADQLFEQKAKEAELAYKEAEINLATAQQKQADSQRLQALDRKAGQMYNSILASGGKRSDAIRAVNNMIAVEGGYEAMMNNQKELESQLTKALEMAKINPQAAALAADFINAIQPQDAPQVTPEQVYQATQKKADFNIGDGRIVTWNQQKGGYETIDMRDAEQKAMAQREMAMKEAESRSRIADRSAANALAVERLARQREQDERAAAERAQKLQEKEDAIEKKKNEAAAIRDEKAASDALETARKSLNPKTDKQDIFAGIKAMGEQPSSDPDTFQQQVERMRQRDLDIAEYAVAQYEKSDPARAVPKRQALERLKQDMKKTTGSGRLSNLLNKYSTPGAQAPAPQSATGKVTDTPMSIVNPLYVPYAVYNLLKDE